MTTMQQRHTRDGYTVAHKIQGFTILAKLVLYFFLAYGAYVFYEKFIAEDLAVPKIEEFEAAFSNSDSQWELVDTDDMNYFVVSDIDLVLKYIGRNNYHNFLVHEASVINTYRLTDDYYVRLDFDVPEEQSRFEKVFSKGMKVKKKEWGHHIYEKRYIFQNGIREISRTHKGVYSKGKRDEVLPEYKEQYIKFYDMSNASYRKWRAREPHFFYSGEALKNRLPNVEIVN